MKTKINLISLIFLSGLLLFGYTNCEELEGTKTSSSVDSSNQLSNGEGYSGVQYNSFDTLNSCFTSIIEPVSTVTIISGVPHLTRENCQDITPRPISESIIADHNKEVALYEELLFDRADFSASEILCRGNRINDNTGNREVADVQIRRDNGQFFANIKLGIYDANTGQLINAAQTDNYEFQKRITNQNNGLTIINYAPKTGSDSEANYHMAVRQDPDDGKLYSIVSQIVQMAPGETPPPIETVLTIEMMECYMHEEFPGSGGTTVNQPTGNGPRPTPPAP